MSMGLSLGLLTAYFTWRPTKDPQDSLLTAAVIGSLYWITGISGILYPGAKWQDPEFGIGSPQRKIFIGHLVLVWVGYWLEMKRLSA